MHMICHSFLWTNHITPHASYMSMSLLSLTKAFLSILFPSRQRRDTLLSLWWALSHWHCQRWKLGTWGRRKEEPQGWAGFAPLSGFEVEDIGRCQDGCLISGKWCQKRTSATLLSFKFSSSACMEQISAGVSVIELFERSNKANWVRLLWQNAAGKLDSWLDLRWTSLYTCCL